MIKKYYNRETEVEESVLIENEHFKLFIRKTDVVLSTVKLGYPLKSFDLITREYPRIKINSFPALRKALTQVGDEFVIGTWLPLIDLAISPDKLQVEVIVNANAKEIAEEKNEQLVEISQALDKLGVVFGRQDLTKLAFKTGVPLIAAIGRAAVKGEDAVVTYLERPARKPVIREDGTANHYEMNFVFPVEIDQWLGEKIFPKEGKDGMDVFGKSIPALKGNDAKLQYDRKSIYEEEQEDKVILRALHGGTLEYDRGIMRIGKLLVIQEDVGPGTGSITFEGAVKILGTIHDGYSVTATEDISVEGNEGITNAKMIYSTAGDIYIKGGVFGSDETTIEAKGNIYLKHANNCRIYGKEVHVGLYLIGSDVLAEHVYVDKSQGRIIGGKVEALYTIECAVSGNSHERETILQVKGIERKELLKDIQEMAQDLKEAQEYVMKLKAQVAKFDGLVDRLPKEQAVAYEKMQQTIVYKENGIIALDQKIQEGLKILKMRKEIQIEVVKEAHPGTKIQIGHKKHLLNKPAMGIFRIVDGVLNI